MNTTKIRDTLVFLLHKFLERPVIAKEQAAERPEYPYLAYKFITSGNEREGMGEIEYFPEGREVIRKKVQVQHCLSFSAYGKTEAETREFEEKAKKYLLIIGYQELSEKEIIPLRATEIQNRSVLETEEYEVRYGFDFFIRSTQIREKPAQPMEHFTIRRKA